MNKSKIKHRFEYGSIWKNFGTIKEEFEPSCFFVGIFSPTNKFVGWKRTPTVGKNEKRE